LTLAVEELLRRLKVEDGERRRAEGVHVAEPGDADDLEVLLRLNRRDGDRVADVIAFAIRGAGVDDDLAVPVGPGALDEVERVEALRLGIGLDPEAEAGRALRVDGLPVRADDLGVRLVVDAVAERPWKSMSAPFPETTTSVSA
jgi:hypothetical protein